MRTIKKAKGVWSLLACAVGSRHPGAACVSSRTVIALEQVDTEYEDLHSEKESTGEGLENVLWIRVPETQIWLLLMWSWLTF